MNLSKYSKRISYLTTFILSIAVSFGLTACSSEGGDEETSDIVGTWILSDGVSLTLNDDNTGYIIMPADDDVDDEASIKNLSLNVKTRTSDISRASESKRINLTYVYNAKAHTLTLYGKEGSEAWTYHWTEVSIENNIFSAKDEEGDLITGKRYGSDTSDDDNPATVTGDIDINKLYGTWLYGDFKLTVTKDKLTFTEYTHDEKGSITWNFTYTYDEDTHKLTYVEEGYVLTNTITTLSDNRLTLTNFKNTGMSVTFANENIKFENISLLYGKKWTYSGFIFNFEFDSKNYDIETKTITTSILNVKYKFTIKGIASDVLLCDMVGDDGEGDPDTITNLSLYPVQ